MTDAHDIPEQAPQPPISGELVRDFKFARPEDALETPETVARQIKAAAAENASATETVIVAGEALVEKEAVGANEPPPPEARAAFANLKEKTKKFLKGLGHTLDRILENNHPTPPATEDLGPALGQPERAIDYESDFLLSGETQQELTRAHLTVSDLLPFFKPSDAQTSQEMNRLSAQKDKAEARGEAPTELPSAELFSAHEDLWNRYQLANALLESRGVSTDSAARIYHELMIDLFGADEKIARQAEQKQTEQRLAFSASSPESEQAAVSFRQSIDAAVAEKNVSQLQSLAQELEAEWTRHTKNLEYHPPDFLTRFVDRRVLGKPDLMGSEVRTEWDAVLAELNRTRVAIRDLEAERAIPPPPQTTKPHPELSDVRFPPATIDEAHTELARAIELQDAFTISRLAEHLRHEWSQAMEKGMADASSASRRRDYKKAIGARLPIKEPTAWDRVLSDISRAGGALEAIRQKEEHYEKQFRRLAELQVERDALATVPIASKESEPVTIQAMEQIELLMQPIEDDTELGSIAKTRGEAELERFDRAKEHYAAALQHTTRATLASRIAETYATQIREREAQREEASYVRDFDEYVEHAAARALADQKLTSFLALDAAAQARRLQSEPMYREGLEMHLAKLDQELTRLDVEKKFRARLEARDDVKRITDAVRARTAALRLDEQLRGSGGSTRQASSSARASTPPSGP